MRHASGIQLYYFHGRLKFNLLTQKYYCLMHSTYDICHLARKEKGFNNDVATHAQYKPTKNRFELGAVHFFGQLGSE